MAPPPLSMAARKLGGPMQTTFTAEQLAGPGDAHEREDPADLRALRLLHRDLSDLRAARRRARQPARPHLPDEGDAGERRAAGAGDRQAYRPLPVLPLLHDHLPVRRALHASGRSRPRLYRGALSAAVVRAAAAGAAATHDSLSAAFRLSLREPRQRGHSRVCFPRGCGRCSSWRRAPAGALAGGPPAGLPAPRATRVRVALLSGCAQQVLARRSTRRRSGCSPGSGPRWWCRGAWAVAGR